MVSSADTIFFSLCCLDNLDRVASSDIGPRNLGTILERGKARNIFFSLFPKSEDFVFSLEVDCAGLECGHVTVRGDRRLGSIYRKVSCHVTKRYRIKSPKV